MNTVADELSKMYDYDDWGVSDKIFECFNKMWGGYTCDLFADSKNTKVKKIYSRFLTPGTSGVDVFAQNWADENCWVVPLPVVICRVIVHMRICKAFGTLIIPKWKSSFPMVWKAKSNKAPLSGASPRDMSYCV